MVRPPKKCKPLAEEERKPLVVASETVLKEQQAQARLERLNWDAAGIDIGATSHFVAVPAGRDELPVREFPAFTADLQRLADWLTQCGIRTVAMESTGVYWIPLFELLESRGFEVLLVNAHHVKNVPGRKSDVLDCQWLQELHTFGLLRGAFRPEESMCVLRAYLRQRANLVRYAGMHIQHMQKALNQMNLHLHHVVSDITGVTGMKVIRAILAGERDPQVLAQHRDRRCRHSCEMIAKALHGSWREEHLFALRQAVELFDTYQQQIARCDEEIARVLVRLDPATEEDTPPPVRKHKGDRNTPRIDDLRGQLFRLVGVDLTRIDGLNSHSVLKILAEIGTDMSRWPSVKQFCSWLGLSPGNKISGGKRIGKSKTTPSANRAAAALRIAAQALSNSQSALGGYLRRQKARLGAPKAITATAHKLATILYSMIANKTEYDPPEVNYYDVQYRKRVLANLRRRADQLGFDLIERPA
jgi:transposase